MMKVLLCIVALFILSTDGHSRRFKSAFSRGFKSIICRMKHHKVILNERNHYRGCEKKCPKGHKELYTLHRGHHCKPFTLPKGCADELCVRCVPSYNWMYKDGSSECVEKCPSGYWSTPMKICQKCSITDCDECSDNWTCEKCSKQTALYETDMKSTICVNDCPNGHLKEYRRGIPVCVKQVKVTTTKRPTPEKTTKDKVIVPEGCKDVNCMTCQTGYFKHYLEAGGSQCLGECPIGYSGIGALCVACSDKRCASCKNSLAECDKCFPEYIMVLDAFNISSECVPKCPRKYREEMMDGARVCIKKTKNKDCPVANCKKCFRQNLHIFHSGCYECSSNFTLFRGTFRDNCYKTCPEGHYETTKPGTDVKICDRCSESFCSRCDKNQCSKCIAPMIYDETLLRCTTCPVLTDYDFQRQECVRLGQGEVDTELNEVDTQQNVVESVMM